MKTRNFLLATAMMLGAAGSTACSTQAPSLAEDDPPANVRDPNADFYGMIRRVHFDYEAVHTVTELEERSSLIVRGSVVGLEEGRTLGRPTGDVDGQHTVVLHVAVADVLKGAPVRDVYVEVFRSFPTSVAELKAQLPSDHEMTFYLTPARSGRGQVYDDGMGHPAGTPLSWLTSPQGLAVSHEGAVVYPLADREEWPR